MKMIFLVALAAALSLSAKGNGKPPSCTNAEVSFAIADDNPGLSSDDHGLYVSQGTGGTAGAVTAILNCNGESAELVVGAASGRSVYLNLGVPVDGTDSLQNPAAVYFFNIPFGNCFNNAQPNSNPNCATFTTYFKGTMAASGYYFNMENPNATAPVNSASSCGTGLNSPYCTSLVQITHSPQVVDPDGNITSPEMWIVTPIASPSDDPRYPNLGTLQGSGKHGVTNVGQFQAPFSITIMRR